MNKNKEYSIPKFNNMEEEDKFWKSHSPLMEGHKGKVQKKKQKRASFLSIRLTDKELAQLRDQAISYGLGPSTYARQLIVQKLESKDLIPTDLLFAIKINSFTNKMSDEQKEIYVDELHKMWKSYRQMQEDIARQMLGISPPNILHMKIAENVKKK